MAENKPYNRAFGFSAGRRDDCLIGVDHMAIPVTIRGSRFSATAEVIKGPSLWVRQDDSDDRDAVPLNLGGEVYALGAAGAVTNGRITFRNTGEAYHFVAGDTVKTYAYSSGECIATGATVVQVSGENNIITVDTNMLGIKQYDKVVITTNDIGGGASADERACVILEDITINSGETLGTKAYIKGSFVKSMINGAQYVAYGQTVKKDIFTQHNNQLIQLIDIQ